MTQLITNYIPTEPTVFLPRNLSKQGDQPASPSERAENPTRVACFESEKRGGKTENEQIEGLSTGDTRLRGQSQLLSNLYQICYIQYSYFIHPIHAVPRRYPAFLFHPSDPSNPETPSSILILVSNPPFSTPSK